MKFDRQLWPAAKTSWVSRMVVKQFQDGGRLPFLKSIYRHISVKNHPIFIKFCTQQQIWTGWTSRNQKWKSCIGQTPSSTERIYCWYRKQKKRITITVSCPTWIIFNNLEWPLIQISRARQYSTLNISETVKDSNINSNLAHAPLKAVISHDLAYIDHHDSRRFFSYQRKHLSSCASSSRQ